jgi:type IV secretory pathway VirB3-like protein
MKKQQKILVVTLRLRRLNISLNLLIYLISDTIVILSVGPILTVIFRGQNGSNWQLPCPPVDI